MKRRLRGAALAAAAWAMLGFAGCHGTAGSPDGRQAADSSGSSGSSGSSAASGGSGGGASEGRGSSGGASSTADTVAIPQEDQTQAGIRVAAVQVRSVARQLAVAGQITVDERHTDHIGVLAEGQIERVLVLPGDRVRPGQTLAWMHSHMVHETVGALVQAYAAVDRQRAEVRFAEINRARYQRLLQLEVASQEEEQRAEQQLRQAQQALTDAEASVHMEREHLSELLQVPPSSLTPDSLYARELIPIRAVSGGSVIEREVSPGQVMTVGQEAFLVSNLSTVWMSAAVNEGDLAGIRRGARVVVTTQAYPDTGFPGTVAMIGDRLDPQTRTVPVRVQLSNPAERLRPGMFATARIDQAATRQAIFVPEDALQDVNGIRVVFVTADGTHFSARAVQEGGHADSLVEIRQGLAAGERVVVSGAFMVKSELMKGSVGEG